MRQDETTVVPCPGCGKSVPWNESSPYRPFCSKRCQLIDLGEWAAEEKVIAGSQLLSDQDEWSEDSGKDQF
ncbi:DNA gyrase inhibitor YacG [Citrobacter sp. JGM124]|uniref:DNA gyrase inhibitor YacG n=1 Tax=Citrobacter sp. JGM124 TaxID=2799789 RepID=UPI001BA9A001|nr:DNA gyrase inhibitor YacG [Citrobacter sp. JGM124]MBS0848481.1 DNA gyrase inhibitor YacG [Citrobacter sp. JGM124]